MEEDNKYNNTPVHYCKHCLSLRVMRLFDNEDTCYCDKCGSTDIETAHITAWQTMYKYRYNKDFL